MDSPKILRNTYSSTGSGRSQLGSSLTWPRASSSIIICSIEATSLRVNTAVSGLIEIGSIPALTRNFRIVVQLFSTRLILIFFSEATKIFPRIFSLCFSIMYVIILTLFSVLSSFNLKRSRPVVYGDKQAIRSLYLL